jgi:phosphoribosylformylglycinamidine synthase
LRLKANTFSASATVFRFCAKPDCFPGALIRNENLHFVCKYTNVKVENRNTPYTSELETGEVLSIPIAHAEGNYVCDDETFQRLDENNQIVFRYCDETGETTAAANPNGSRSNIAGICNENGNVLGMMPHPERACEELLGSNDGRDIFRSLTNAISRNEQ